MKLPKSVYNWISFVGTVLAIICLIFITMLFIYTRIFQTGSSYIGLFIYILIPAFMIFGLILIPIGMVIKRRSIRKHEIAGTTPRLPYIDLNDNRHRNAFVIFTVSTVILLFASGVGSYEAFHYTESVEFCGTLCHDVMEPEYVAYQNSPHARVRCVECHVGEGADWYVKSKLSGLYQVYSVLRNLYPRPIPTPLHDLRPARETCEKCHWPEKFYARKLRVQKNFIADSANTEWDITMQMKIGPAYSALGLQEGIHWHINPDVRIEYITSDIEHENIPWVKYTNLSTGVSRIFKDTENPPSDSLLKASEAKEMSCIDCHNRPSHNYLSPADFIDNELIAGRLPRDIPYIKFAAMSVLYKEFSTRDSANMAIENEISQYYKDAAAEYFAANEKKIKDAIKTIQASYSKYVFPSMKVSHKYYPNHIGHLETNGCFRCHNDKHEAEDGTKISRDCELCHVIISQGSPSALESVAINDTLFFKHPVDIDDAWKETNCSECHVALF